MSVWYSLIAISLGSMVGGLARYGLAQTMNVNPSPIPPGTLVANLVAAYIIGGAIAIFSHSPHLSPAWRLFVVTGLCGGLSTFSTFSVELLALLKEGRLLMAALMLALHVGGSVLLAALGMASVTLLRTR